MTDKATDVTVAQADYDPDFVEAWTAQEDAGFIYSESNIAKVYLGWQMARAASEQPASGEVAPAANFATDDDLIEAAVQAALDAGLAENGVHGVAAARFAARFVVQSREYWRDIERANLADEVRQIKEAKQSQTLHGDVGMGLAAAFGPIMKTAFPDRSAIERMRVCEGLSAAVVERSSWLTALSTTSEAPEAGRLRDRSDK